MTATKSKAKLLNIKRFPMDMARLACWFLLPLFRIQRVTPTGERYRGKLHGGAIIAANHTAMEDPLVAAVTFWYRRAFFLIGEAVMKGKIRPTLLRGAGGIKIERGIADLDAIKKSVGVLKEGHILIMFPQGRIVESDDIEALKSGAALMALQAGVPIVPIHICPPAHWYSRRRVVIGDTVYPSEICKRKIPSTADIRLVTDTLMDEMNRCNPTRSQA